MAVSAVDGEMVRRRRPARPRTGGSRPGPVPRPWTVDAATVVVGLGFGLCVGVALTAETRAQLAAAGGIATFLGSLTGLAGAYLALVMVLLVSRIPAVERVLGQDGLLRWHRRVSPWTLSLITAHAVLITVGYAQAARTGAWHEVGVFLSQYPDMAMAAAALVLMLAIGVASIHSIRRRFRRETWWAFHLLMYLALALAFFHEIALGPSFVGHPLTRAVWTVAWASTAGLVIVYRIGLPGLRSFRHRLEVVEVRPEAPGVVSVILKGRRIEALAVSGGQFFEWRFLVPGLWWQAHPFSLSARPQAPYLRLTVKVVGDFTAAVAGLRPGTRVAVEGPYGAFTADARRRAGVAIIAGGIGVTAARSLLEDLPPGADPVVVLRVSAPGDLVLAGEVAELVRQRHGRVHEVVGPRAALADGWILRLVPDLAERDVYVSGSESFVTDTRALVAAIGVPPQAIHSEVFAL